MKLRTLPTILLLSLLSLTGCDAQSPSDAKKGERPPPSVGVVAALDASGVRLHRPGQLEPLRTITVTAQEEGVLEQYPYQPGDRVKGGTVVAKLDDRQLQAELRRTQAERQQQQQNLQRLQRLTRQQAVSEEELNQAETALEVAKAEEELLRIRVANTTLRAPFDAVVAARHTEVGNVVERLAPLLDLYDLSALRCRVELPQSLLEQLKAGDEAIITTDPGGRETTGITAVIERIHPGLDPQSGQGEVELLLQESPSRLRAGQWVDVAFRVSEELLTLVPFATLRHDDGGDYLFRLTPEGTVEKFYLSTGRFFANWVEVGSGIAPGDQIVLSGLEKLRDGMHVTPQPATLPEPGQ